MTKIPIITQNFSSPDCFNDTPLMLLPQAPLPPLPDKDQDGFNQLLLHDLYRHRQTYVRSFTAFETLKKRQDFVLRQENLRSLQNFEQRITAKQDQYIDQSFHSYEQCFVKVINGNLTQNGNISDQQKRPRTAAPAFDKYHMHQLSHTLATPLDPPAIIPFHRYQKSHRPPLRSKHRTQANIHHSAQSLHDAFQSTRFTNQGQPFLSFTESYLQKYGDRSANKFQITNGDAMDYIKENEDDDDAEHLRSASADLTYPINENKKHEQKMKTSDLQRVRATPSSRNTNTPSSTPQLSYNDALRDGLTINKDDDDLNDKMSAINEKRRSSQQSSSQLSTSDTKSNTKRPKTGKKKQVVVDLASDKKATPSTTDNDLLTQAITVQNYGNNNTDQNLYSKMDRLQVPTTTTGSRLKKTSSILRRSSIQSNDGILEVTQTLDNIDTQMTTTPDGTEQLIIDDNKDQILTPVPTNTIENKPQINDQLPQQQKQGGGLELLDRKLIKKGAFDASDSMKDMVAFELGLGSNRGAMKKTRFNLNGKENNRNLNEDGTEQMSDNQATLDLLERIRQSAAGLPIGQMPVSQQGCRFELPYDLKLLETLTPLEYLSKYCRLSSRRTYQFKRIFDKYRTNQYRLESTNLYSSIIDIHSASFTRLQYDNLCQLIDIGNQQYQYTFETFAGILALCERVLYDSSIFRSGFDDHDLAKDTIEKCDFDSLDRKFDGLIISESMKRLLKKI